MTGSDNRLGRRPFLEQVLTALGGLAAGTIAYPIIHKASDG